MYWVVFICMAVVSCLTHYQPCSIEYLTGEKDNVLKLFCSCVISLQSSLLR